MSYEFMGWRISSIEDARREALEVLKSGGSFAPGIYREFLTDEQLEDLDAREGGRA